MIVLSFYKQENFDELTNYNLNEEQSSFTSSPEFALTKIKESLSKDKYPIVIYHEEKAVGFFVLDFGIDKLDLTENNNSVLMRSLSINPEYQGKGIGKYVMLNLPQFVKANFSNCNEIVLAVNFKNKLAYNIYLKCGYIDDGKTRHGYKDLQHILSIKVQ